MGRFPRTGSNSYRLDEAGSYFSLWVRNWVHWRGALSVLRQQRSTREPPWNPRNGTRMVMSLSGKIYFIVGVLLVLCISQHEIVHPFYLCIFGVRDHLLEFTFIIIAWSHFCVLNVWPSKLSHRCIEVRAPPWKLYGVLLCLFHYKYSTGFFLFFFLRRVLRLRVLPEYVCNSEVFHTSCKTEFLCWCLNPATVVQDPVSGRGKVNLSVRLPLRSRPYGTFNPAFTLFSSFPHYTQLLIIIRENAPGVLNLYSLGHWLWARRS